MVADVVIWPSRHFGDLGFGICKKRELHGFKKDCTDLKSGKWKEESGE